jgi:hypothetical protein
MIDKLFTKLKAQGEDMGLFERTHLSDQSPSAPCRGPSRGLHDTDPMESQSFAPRRPQGGPLAEQEQMRTGEECHVKPF